MRARTLPWLIVLLTLTASIAVLVRPGDAAARGVAPSGRTATSSAGVVGPNAVTAFGTAAKAVPGTTLHGLAAGVVGIAPTPDGGGYWLVAADGGVFSFGNARFYGSTGGQQLNAPVVGMAAAPDGGGYWLVAADGGVFSFGNARFYGSTGGQQLNAPVVGMAAAPDGDGYWLVAADGGVFSFGTARFVGSDGGQQLNAPVVGMAGTPDGGGYWLVAADGGVFSFGTARFHGSTGGRRLNAPVVGMAAAPDGGGYWLVAADGGVFSFGTAPFVGSDGGTPPNAPAVGIAGRRGGYWIAYGADLLESMVPSIAAYVAGRSDNVTVAVEDLGSAQILQFRPGVIENTASTLKVDILATLLDQAQAEGRALTPAEQSFAVPMIEDSLDSAADVLWGELGPGAVGNLEREAGMTSTVPATNGIWGATTTSAEDRLAMMRLVVEPNGVLSDSSRSYILNLMENITPTQDWGASGGVPPGVTVALKNGFAIINGWQINTEGWVSGGGRNYLIAVLTNGNPSEDYGIQTVDAISSIVWQDMAG